MKSVDILKSKGTMSFTAIFLLIIAYSFLQGILLEYIFKSIIGYNFEAVLCSYIFSAISILVLIKIIEKSTWVEFGFNKNNRREVFKTGIGTSVLGLIVIFGALVVSNNIRINLSDNISYMSILILFLLVLIQGILEEIIFRGYLMSRIAAKKSKWIAVFGSTIFYLVFHMSNPNTTKLSFFNIFLISIVMCLLYWYFDNVLVVAIFHGIWNCISGVILGFNISGIKVLNSVFTIKLLGDMQVVTGGDFGLDGSIIATLYFAILALIIYMGLYLKMFRKIAEK